MISARFETADAKQILSFSLDRLQGQLLQEFEIPVLDDEVTELCQLMNTAKLLNASVFFSYVVSKILPERVMEEFKQRLFDTTMQPHPLSLSVIGSFLAKEWESDTVGQK